jgi:flagellar basal-body rod protein FlgB
MALDDIPLFAMLRGRLGYLSERQRVIAENVANADTPGYAAKDIKPFSFAAAATALSPVEPSVTSARHMSGTIPRARSTYKTHKSDDSETTLDGNSVVLEEEMMKMTEARLDYDAAIGFYQKSLGLLRMATRRPGAS